MWYCLTSYHFQFVFILVAGGYYPFRHFTLKSKQKKRVPIFSDKWAACQKNRSNERGGIILAMSFYQWGHEGNSHSNKETCCFGLANVVSEIINSNRTHHKKHPLEMSEFLRPNQIGIFFVNTTSTSRPFVPETVSNSESLGSKDRNGPWHSEYKALFCIAAWGQRTPGFGCFKWWQRRVQGSNYSRDHCMGLGQIPAIQRRCADSMSGTVGMNLTALEGENRRKCQRQWWLRLNPEVRKAFQIGILSWRLYKPFLGTRN